MESLQKHSERLQLTGLDPGATTTFKLITPLAIGDDGYVYATLYNRHSNILHQWRTFIAIFGPEPQRETMRVGAHPQLHDMLLDIIGDIERALRELGYRIKKIEAFVVLTPLPLASWVLTKNIVEAREPTEEYTTTPPDGRDDVARFFKEMDRISQVRFVCEAKP